MDFDHFGIEFHEFADAVFFRDAAEIGPQLVLRRIMLRPVVIRLEGIGIEVVRVVDAAAGIGVLEPGAAHIAVLVHDRERDACLLEPDRGQHAGHARADDQHAKIFFDAGRN